MNLHQQFYDEISRLPAERLRETLQSLLPPAQLALRMDGTLFRFSEHGAHLFRIQTVLAEAGIPQEDPRTRLFSGLLGWLIDPDIPARLRAIAHKQDTLMTRIGALKTFDASGRKAWWVPLGVTARFAQCRQDWFAEFAQAREALLLDPYEQVYQHSRERVLASARAAWQDLARLGKTSAPCAAYIQQAEQIFTQRFPTPDQIRARLRLACTPCQAALPVEWEQIYRRLQNQDQARAAAELAEIRQRTQTAASQLSLLEHERDQQQAEADRRQAERALREQLIREQLQPDIEQAQQVVLQVQARIIRLCQDILNKVQTGAPVSAATRRAWNRAFRELSALTPDHPHLLQALASMQDLSSDPADADPRQVAAAQRQIGEALSQIERQAAVHLQAEALWQLLQAGQAEAALARIASLRAQLSHRLDEVESLYELMTALGAQSEQTLLETPAPLEALS